jgi:opacity protein-like surface antigen
MNKKLILAMLPAALFINSATAGFYVSAKIGASDFVVDANQWQYNTPSNPANPYKTSTIVDGNISDINAIYDFSVGYIISKRVRLEADYSYSHFTINGNWVYNDEYPLNPPQTISYPATYQLDNKLNRFMFNLYVTPFKFNTGRGAAEFYLTGGMGLTKMKEVGSVVIDLDKMWPGNGIIAMNAPGSHSNLTASVGAGISIPITNSLSMDAEYRYVDAGKYKESNPTSGITRDYSSHDVMIGFRYEFSTDRKITKQKKKQNPTDMYGVINQINRGNGGQ